MKTSCLNAVETMKIHEAMRCVHEWVHEADKQGKTVCVRVEDARQRRWIPSCRGKEALQGVGSVKRDAVIWADFLAQLSADFPDVLRVQMVAPRCNRTKMSAATFARLTGWTRRCSEHARDAAMLVWRR